MLNPAREPLHLGRGVQHGRDPTKGMGTIIGWVFEPAPQALVLWQDGATTLEVRRDLETLVDATADEEIRCALCRRAVEAQQSVIFRIDGRVEHVACRGESRDGSIAAGGRRHSGRA